VILYFDIAKLSHLAFNHHHNFMETFILRNKDI